MVNKLIVKTVLKRAGEYFKDLGSIAEYNIHSGPDVTASYLLKDGQTVVRVTVDQKISSPGEMYTAVTALDFKRMNGLDDNMLPTLNKPYLRLANGSDFEAMLVACDTYEFREFLKAFLPEPGQQPKPAEQK
jgi:hypothetical protein